MPGKFFFFFNTVHSSGLTVTYFYQSLSLWALHSSWPLHRPVHMLLPGRPRTPAWGLGGENFPASPDSWPLLLFLSDRLALGATGLPWRRQEVLVLQQEVTFAFTPPLQIADLCLASIPRMREAPASHDRNAQDMSKILSPCTTEGPSVLLCPRSFPWVRGGSPEKRRWGNAPSLWSWGSPRFWTLILAQT